jgi:hypothetical protein
VSKHLSDEELELALEMLAGAINAAGAEKETLLLSKLCFTLANELADLEILQTAIDTAKKDL